MTSKPDTKRNLGPILAIAGGAVVLAAVIWGFIAVGGPGDARARRIDSMTVDRIASIASLAQCAVETGKPPPETIADIKALQGQNVPPDSFGRCSYVAPGTLDRLDGVEYSANPDGGITICASFQRPTEEAGRADPYPYVNSSAFPELQNPHPAGRHCYDIRMIKPLNPTPMPDPVPASPPFR